MHNPIALMEGYVLDANQAFCHNCEYAVDGKMPAPVPLDEGDDRYSIDKGNPGDYFPPCCKSQVASVGHWQEPGKREYPKDLHPLRLFKCRQCLWVVVPGIYDQTPQHFFKSQEEYEAFLESEYDLYLSEQTSIANEVIDAIEAEQEIRYSEGDW